MLGGADNPNGELPSYITGADTYGSFKDNHITARLYARGYRLRPEFFK